MLLLGRRDDGDVKVVIEGSLVFLGVFGFDFFLKDCLNGLGFRLRELLGWLEK